MQWYYVEGGQRRGPVSQEDLENLARSNTIGPETLVWREGMAEWRPYRQFQPLEIPPEQPSAPLQPPTPAEWFYVDAGRRMGPVTTHELENLARNRTVEADTLVWREGMTTWQAYREVRPAALAPTSTPAHPQSQGPICVECGKPFPADELIQYEGSYVCAACKPAFFQKLKEGVRISNARINGPMNYAGFWIRVLAHFIDVVILSVVVSALVFVIAFVVGLASFGMRRSGGSYGGMNIMLILSLEGIFFLIIFGLSAWYFTWFTVKRGATPGKLLLHLKVVRADGVPLTYARAFGRLCGLILSFVCCYIGVIMVGFDDEKRALHDRLCDTCVVKQ